MVFTTLANESDALSFVEELVGRRLIACGTILPARSVYRWEGRVTNETEALVMLKSRRGRLKELMDAASQRHPYDVPEVLAVPVEDGLPDYLQWMMDETRGGDGEPLE